MGRPRRPVPASQRSRRSARGRAAVAASEGLDRSHGGYFTDAIERADWALAELTERGDRAPLRLGDRPAFVDALLIDSPGEALSLLIDGAGEAASRSKELWAVRFALRQWICDVATRRRGDTGRPRPMAPTLMTVVPPRCHEARRSKRMC